MVYIFMISAVAVIILTFMQSAMRTKSGMRWKNGLNLKKKLSNEEVYQIVQNLKYPMLENVSMDEQGKILVNTKFYTFETVLTEDIDGNTVVCFSIDWIKAKKTKAKRIAFCWDELYQFLQQEVTSGNTEKAMKVYQKNKNLFSVLRVAQIVCFGSMILIAIMTM